MQKLFGSGLTLFVLLFNPVASFKQFSHLFCRLGPLRQASRASLRILPCLLRGLLRGLLPFLRASCLQGGVSINQKEDNRQFSVDCSIDVNFQVRDACRGRLAKARLCLTTFNVQRSSVHCECEATNFGQKTDVISNRQRKRLTQVHYEE